jgi:hypothetical protein
MLYRALMSVLRCMRWGQTKINYACCAGNNVRSRPKTSKQEIVFLAVAICPGQAGLGARGWRDFTAIFSFARAGGPWPCAARIAGTRADVVLPAS